MFLGCLFLNISPKSIDSYYHRYEHGVIKNCYPADQLEIYTGCLTFMTDGWKDEPTVSLREAARKQAPWNAFTANAYAGYKGFSKVA